MDKEPTGGTPLKKENRRVNKNWLLVAIIGFIAAFFFQWKNSLDQSSIAQTDSDTVVRVKVENGKFKFFSNKELPPIEALLSDSDGNVLGSLVPVSDAEKTFTTQLCVSQNTAARTRFVNIVILSLKRNGIPVVLTLENPFR